jgi:hypothetical protein
MPSWPATLGIVAVLSLLGRSIDFWLRKARKQQILEALARWESRLLALPLRRLERRVAIAGLRFWQRVSALVRPASARPLITAVGLILLVPFGFLAFMVVNWPLSRLFEHIPEIGWVVWSLSVWLDYVYLPLRLITEAVLPVGVLLPLTSIAFYFLAFGWRWSQTRRSSYFELLLGGSLLSVAMTAIGLWLGAWLSGSWTLVFLQEIPSEAFGLLIGITLANLISVGCTIWCLRLVAIRRYSAFACAFVDIGVTFVVLMSFTHWYFWTFSLPPLHLRGDPALEALLGSSLPDVFKRIGFTGLWLVKGVGQTVLPVVMGVFFPIAIFAGALLVLAALRWSLRFTAYVFGVLGEKDTTPFGLLGGALGSIVTTVKAVLD